MLLLFFAALEEPNFEQFGADPNFPSGYNSQLQVSESQDLVSLTQIFFLKDIYLLRRSGMNT